MDAGRGLTEDARSQRSMRYTNKRLLGSYVARWRFESLSAGCEIVWMTSKAGGLLAAAAGVAHALACRPPTDEPPPSGAARLAVVQYHEASDTDVVRQAALA